MTLAIAQDAQIGVVIATWSSRLSRIYKWDIENDKFTPGQFLKGRAYVLTISPDGKYVVYYAEVHHKMHLAYLAISHLPYFTAHAFFLGYHLTAHTARFCSKDLLEVGIIEPSHTLYGKSEYENRIDPGCPFTIRVIPPVTRETFNHPYPGPYETSSAIGAARSRRVLAAEDELLGAPMDTEDWRLIASFPKEEFQEVIAPDWAQNW